VENILKLLHFEQQKKLSLTVDTLGT